MSTEKSLEVKNIWKRFPGVTALKDVSLTIQKGESYGILGENGAGKSTLVKIITGLYNNEEGEIFINGKKEVFHSTHDSQIKGISIVSQETLLIPFLNIAENISISNLPHSFGIIDKKSIHERAKSIFDQIGIDFDTHTKISALSGRGELQLIQIAKALSQKPSILILDEATASLNNEEKSKVFDVIKNLNKQGITTIFISHILEDVFDICERICILKDGEKVCEEKIKNLSIGSVIKMMVGEELFIKRLANENTKKLKTSLKLEELTNEPYYKKINMEFYEKEIVGIFGLRGAGKSELFKTIYGLMPTNNGYIYINNNRKKIKNVLDARSSGIGFIPDERRALGILLKMNVNDNILLPSYSKISSGGVINKAIENELTSKYIDLFSIKTPSKKFICENLSGGNQQKIVIAKWLAANSSILLCDEPTIGIDVGAKEEIYKILIQMVDLGKTVIISSIEPEEIMTICNRCYVMYKGNVVGCLTEDEINKKNLWFLANGGTN